MKKLILLTLIAAMLLALSACGGTNNVGIIGGADGPTQIIVGSSGGGEKTAAGSTEDESRYAFVHKGVSIVPDMEAASILEALGEPLSYFETASCAFEGLGKVYTYGGFELDTYPMDGTDYISSVIFKDDSVSTAEGLMIGDSGEKIVEVYGQPSSSADNLYTYEKGGAQLRFILQAGDIVSIEYMSLVADAQ